MRTTEIKVGTDYAYAHADYASRSRVHVLETGVPRNEGWRPGRKVRNGIRVRFESNGSEAVVASREIREEWEPYAQRQADIAKARKANEEHVRRVMAERARQAKVLDDYLAGHGIEAKSVTYYDRKGLRATLEAAGFPVISTDGNTVAVHTRISSIRDFVLDGEVKVDDLTPVLADLSHRLPKAPAVV